MSTYTDGFVLPLPKDKLDEYKKQAELAGQVWRDHGTLSYRESVLEDRRAESMRSFPHLAGAEGGETVIFAWITFESREHRDEVNAKVMADPRLAEMMSGENQLFDCARMAYGGFKLLVDA